MTNPRLTEQHANAIGHVTRRGACGPTMSDETLEGDQPAPPLQDNASDEGYSRYGQAKTMNSKCLSGYELPDDGSPCPKCGAKEYETCKRQKQQRVCQRCGREETEKGTNGCCTVYGNSYYRHLWGNQNENEI